MSGRSISRNAGRNLEDIWNDTPFGLYRDIYSTRLLRGYLIGYYGREIGISPQLFLPIMYRQRPR